MTSVETATEIRPFHVDIPEEAIEDLRRRIAAANWPQKEAVDDDSQGFPLALIQELAHYWATGYDWRNKGGFFNVKGVSIPVAVSVFPGEQYQAPRRWAEQAYPNLIYFNEVEKGGHFAAWEQPELFSQEIRAAFRSLR
jgi:pimeloyl-ACP methyl ester carboxylesterase